MDDSTLQAGMPRIPSRAYTYLFGFLLFSIYLWILQEPDRLGLLIFVMQGDPIFMDLHCLVAAVEGHALGIDVLSGVNPLDYYGRGHAYSPLWLELPVGLFQMRYLGELAFLAILLFLATTVGVLRPKSLPAAVYGLLLVVSPAVALGIERINNDVIIFSLIFLPFLLPVRWARARPVVMWCCFYLSSVLKYFPAAAFLSLVVTLKERRSFLAAGLAAVVGGALFLVVYLEGFLRTLEIYARPSLLWTHGRDLMFAQAFPEDVAFQAFLVLAIALVAGAALFALSRPALECSPRESRTEGMFTAGAALYCFSFLLNSNFDYRLIFLIPTIPYLFWLLRIPHWKPHAIAVLTCNLLLVWCEFFFFHGVVQTYQDVFFGHLVAFIIVKGLISWTVLGYFLFLLALIVRNHLVYKFALFPIGPVRAVLSRKPAAS